jgi:hypothetical protein
MSFTWNLGKSHMLLTRKDSHPLDESRFLWNQISKAALKRYTSYDYVFSVQSNSVLH